MRYLFLIIAVWNLSACGPSVKEREETAVLTCNILAESRGMGAVFRIKEINAARKELGEEKFLRRDETIRKSFEWELCKELVLGDAIYDKMLAEKKIAKAASDAERAERTASEAEREKAVAAERAERTASEAEREKTVVAQRAAVEAREIKILRSRDYLMIKGEEVYLRNCAGCHQPNGQGIPPAFPSLVGQGVSIGSVDEHIDIVMFGRPGTSMQKFSNQLTATEIAAVITFERNAWGNNTNQLIQPKVINAMMASE